MKKTTPQWIWTNQTCENQVCCFEKKINLDQVPHNVCLEICADTRYVVYWNGQEIGRGPIRSQSDTRYYDVYPLDCVAVKNKNRLCVRVWHYGWSTYQNIAAPAGLWFRVKQENNIIAVSDTTVRAASDVGHRSNTVKRNVNLGFMEYQDATLFTQDWLRNETETEHWAFATQAAAFEGTMLSRPIAQFHSRTVYPQRVQAIQQVRDGCKQISVNTRTAFFGDRRDANETIFCGFIGCVIESPCTQWGVIVFPNRTWNGLLGDFKIDGVLYPVSNENREIRVSLKSGRQLFLMQISGKYDDLYCHMEWKFAQQPHIVETQYAPSFFVIGPTDFIETEVNGIGHVYGGLEEFNRFECFNAKHLNIFNSLVCESDLSCFSNDIKMVSTDYVFEGEYLLSVVRNQVIQRNIFVSNYNAMIYNNTDFTELAAPEQETYNQIVIDFGNLYVGSFCFTVDAPQGTVLDVYCYENNYAGKPEYTIGLNNSFRYRCSEGLQCYETLTRMGCRYAVLTFREQKAPVRIYQVKFIHSTYPCSGNGRFSCNDDALNHIWEMSKTTHELCMEDTFTDCPTYEQAFWIGDAQISAAVNAWLSGSYSFIRHCLQLATTASVNTPMLNALTPTDWNTSIPMWALNWIISVEQYVWHTADKDTLRDLYPEICCLLRYLEKFVDEKGAFVIQAWNMLDWAAMDIYNHGVVTGQQALLAYCMNYGAQLGNMYGTAKDASIFLQCEKRLLEYIDTSLWDEQRNAFLDGWSPEHGRSKTISTQTHTLLYLFHAIVDEKKRNRTQQLLDNPPGDCLSAGSPFILYYQYECWAQDGKLAEMVNDIRTRWKTMSRYDCTTCWEVFPGFYENARTRSYCHSWSSLPVYFFSKYLLGISMSTMAFESISIHIPTVDGLDWCEGLIPTPRGVIEAAWSIENNRQKYRLRVPQEIQIEWMTPEHCEIELIQY